MACIGHIVDNKKIHQDLKTIFFFLTYIYLDVRCLLTQLCQKTQGSSRGADVPKLAYANGVIVPLKRVSEATHNQEAAPPWLAWMAYPNLLVHSLIAAVGH